MNLNELFLHHKGTRSYDDLERACGKELTSQRLQQIATTVPKEFPKAKNIRAISRALGVREVVVVMAAAESLGLDVGRELPKLMQVLPTAASNLSDDEVAAIAHVIRAFKREEVMGNAEHPAPTIEVPAVDPAAGTAGFLLRMLAELESSGEAIPENVQRARLDVVHGPPMDAGSYMVTLDAERTLREFVEKHLPNGAAGGDVRLGVVIGQGDLDEDLDALPDESEDPQPVRGARELPHAARRTDR